MTTGWTELLEHGRRSSISRGRSTFRDYGPDGAADRLSRSTPQLADDTSTLPSSSKPTRQSDALDQEPVEACRSYGGGDNVNRPQTLGREALHGSFGGDCREGNASNSEAKVINGEQGVECQPGQYPDQSWCQPYQCQPGLLQPSPCQCLSGQPGLYPGQSRGQLDQCKPGQGKP